MASFDNKTVMHKANHTVALEAYRTPACTVIPLVTSSAILDISTPSLSRSSGEGWDDEDD